MANKKLLIVGAGQYGMLSREVAESMGVFEKIDFLDDKNKIAIGRTSEYGDFASDYTYAFVAIGDNSFRLQMIKKLKEANYKIAVLISPMAYVSPSAQVGEGTIVEPMAVVQAKASVSYGCLVCSGAVVKHNAFVAEGCYLDCNSVVQAGAWVPDRAKIKSCTEHLREEIIDKR